MGDLTVVVPYRDHPDGLRRLLGSLPSELPVIVVDDCSETPLKLRRRGVKILRREQRGFFAGAVNTGINACDTDVLVLNQDVWAEGEAWLDELEALRGEYAIVGDGVMGHPAWPRGYVQGTCMYLRRDALSEVGGMDELHWPLWGCTAEWQLRACRAGYKARPIGDCGWFQHERGERPYGSAIQQLLEEQPEQRDLYIRTPPLVSVVTACYNYGRYLPDWLASLTGGQTSLGEHPGQTFQGFEAVICDDRSTDDSWAIAKELADDWKGIRAVRRKRNGGTAAALNTAIRHSYGRYIMVVDADDMLEPQTLETMLTHIEKDNHKLYYSDQQLFASGQRGEVWRMQEYDFDRLLEQNHVPTGTMFSRAGWREAGGYPDLFAKGRQDWAFSVAMGAKGYCGVRVPKPLYLYRREGQNRSLQNTTLDHRNEFAMQMRATFPALYRGERPMGCCGGRSIRLLAQRAAQQQALQPGATGMVLIEYVGGNTGRQTFVGPVTKTHYVVKGSHRKIFVDWRDAALMLRIVEDHILIFRQAVVTPVDQPVPEEVE